RRVPAGSVGVRAGGARRRGDDRGHSRHVGARGSPAERVRPRRPGPVTGFRSGIVAVVGRPNVGKSTLVNALVGQKVAIVSDKPQTTRRGIHAIWSMPDAQVVLTDTPGYHKPRTL